MIPVAVVAAAVATLITIPLTYLFTTAATKLARRHEEEEDDGYIYYTYEEAEQIYAALDEYFHDPDEISRRLGDELGEGGLYP